MRRTLALAAAPPGLAFVLPAGAHAGEQALTFTSEPIAVDGYGVATGAAVAPSPSVDGYVGAAPDPNDPSCDGALITPY